MTYDYEKDIEDWKNKHGNVKEAGNPEDLPQIPAWLKGDSVKCNKKE